VNGSFLLVLEAAEVSRLGCDWPGDRLLVAEVADDGSVLRTLGVPDGELDGMLADRRMPVHPSRPGRRTVLLEFSREAALLSSVREALAGPATVEATSGEATSCPAPDPGRIAIPRSAAEAAGLSPGDALVVVFDADGLFAVRTPEAPRPARIHWIWRDLAVAAAMLGSFALGLAGAR
jgi:hypothetical protein